jgi:hypothetical protein
LRRIVASLAFITVGAALVAALVLTPLAAGGALHIAYATAFEVPPRIVATFPHQDVAVLVGGIRWFAGIFAFAIAFGALGAVALVRHRNVDPLARTMFVWIALAVPTLLVQRTSWWHYQWVLLAIPLGAFAAAGVSAAVESSRFTSSRSARLSIAGLVLVTLLLPLRGAERKLVALVTHGFALDGNNRERYREDYYAEYAKMQQDAKLLPAGADVYVFGNPMYYLATHRAQPLVINGWSLDLLLPDERAEFMREFEARPPRYIYISTGDPGHGALFQREPQFARYFARRYGISQLGVGGNLFGPVR